MSAPASASRSDDAPDWSGPTKADVHAQSKRAAQAQRAAALAAYRELHPELNPQAADKTVSDLIYINSWAFHSWGGATALDSREENNAR